MDTEKHIAEFEKVIGRELDLRETSFFRNAYYRGYLDGLKKHSQELERAIRGPDKIIGELDSIQEYRQAKGE